MNLRRLREEALVSARVQCQGQPGIHSGSAPFWAERGCLPSALATCACTGGLPCFLSVLLACGALCGDTAWSPYHTFSL